MITFTQSAAERAKLYVNDETPVLRVAILGGGCSGFRYEIMTDKQEEDDAIFETNGVKLAIDPISLVYLENSTIDYIEDLMGSRFTIDNPNVTTQCGCGASFGV